ncbi:MULTISPECIES: lysophospholipid acyltransferase family protein [Alistipes]|uniref:Lysophospholipid acyltransferase family protein n=2 Tax=Alistipes TaxID=239759 RepID=A0ABY5V9H4_9BACT|nr:lysophospholipid acyltransferase family protein [Alistipes senegalensis]MBD9302833.1 lauroyl acyltransferase [Alistipes senegalensis]MCI7308076.1 lysophospholipid acyltransferase family protein [Alistipes senegalensis]MDY2877641.1 lysophospholipid acyltransferase family protein [Alistipes senegalensis]MDY5241985.1 lysophospholipid acyltransferase family protein [Alistipes senegalensis]UEA86991.1 lysophospholipid acyltransferase family protein [Alistipes senegalensis]
MKTTELTPMQRIGLEALWLGARVFAAMPYWFKYYVVENLIFVLLRYCLRYRMKVVKTNLRNSFPEKDERELAVIRRRFYRTLAEIFVDTINLAGLTPEKGRSLLTVKGLEEQKERVGGRDWIAMTAHFGCWEYCSFWGLYDPTQIVVAVYHPLRSRIVEAFYQRLRNGDYATTVAMKESLRFYLRNRAGGIGGRNLVMGLIADQNPPRRPDSRWFRFLNQDTIFFDGGEKLALRCQLPVYFVKMERLRRGRYEMSFELIYDGKEEVAEYEITQRYVRMLEAEIRRRPELWMWSHRRWKHKRNAGR